MDRPDLHVETELNLSARDKILQVATCYFARFGYYGTSVRDIARETGMTVATLYYYIQSKDHLYRRVFERQYMEEYELVTGIINQAGDEVIYDAPALRELIFRLTDALIERSVQNPDIVRLWTRRWLEKPEQTGDIENQYSVPLYQLCDDLLCRAQQAGTIQPEENNLKLLIHSVTWLQYGYLGFGRLSFEARFNNPFDSTSVSEFRQFLHTFVSNMLRFSDQL